MIDASGGVLDQDYEIFEQQTPHALLKHEYWCDSAGAGRWRGGLGIETEFIIRGDNVKLVTFGDGDVEVARGAQGGKEGTLNVIKLRNPDGAWYTCSTKDIVEGVPEGTLYFQQAGGGGGWAIPGSVARRRCWKMSATEWSASKRRRTISACSSIRPPGP